MCLKSWGEPKFPVTATLRGSRLMTTCHQPAGTYLLRVDYVKMILYMHLGTHAVSSKRPSHREVHGKQRLSTLAGTWFPRPVGSLRSVLGHAMASRSQRAPGCEGRHAQTTPRDLAAARGRSRQCDDCVSARAQAQHAVSLRKSHREPNWLDRQTGAACMAQW